MSSLISDTEKAAMNAAMVNQFDSFKRGFTLYIEAQNAVISTAPTYAGIFGQEDQNVFNPQVTPQSYLISGCILYGNKQPWEYVEPQTRANYQQLKLRESQGIVRLKVDQSGYSLMAQCKKCQLDGFDFTMTSTPRAHGLFSPQVYTFTLNKQD